MDVPEDEAASLATAKSVALPMMMDMIREDLAALGVVHDFFRSSKRCMMMHRLIKRLMN